MTDKVTSLDAEMSGWIESNAFVDSVQAERLLRAHGYKITAAHIDNLGRRSGLCWISADGFKPRQYIAGNLLWWAENVLNKPKRKN